MTRRQTVCATIVAVLALAWSVTLTVVVASLLVEQREHAAALGLICSQPRRGLMRFAPFVRRRGACEVPDDDDLPPALQKALPFLAPLKRRVLHLPLIGAAATYVLHHVPIAGPYLHFLGVSLTRYIMPLAKKVQALFLLVKLTKQGKEFTSSVTAATRAARNWLHQRLHGPASAATALPSARTIR